MSTNDGVDETWRDVREWRRPARDQDTAEAGARADLLVVDDTPLADVTRLRRWESLTPVMQHGLAYARALKPARRDRS